MNPEAKLGLFYSTILSAPVDEYGEFNTILVGQCLSEMVHYKAECEDECIETLMNKSLQAGKVIIREKLGAVFVDLKPQENLVCFLFLSLLKNENWSSIGGHKEIGRIACETLGRIGSMRAVPVLLKLLEDKMVATMIREAAAEALSRIGSMRAVSALLKLLEREYYSLVGRGDHLSIRKIAAEALAKIGNEQAIPALFKLLLEYRVYYDQNDSLFPETRETEHEVYMIAAEALAKIDNEQVISELISLFKDPYHWVLMTVPELIPLLTNCWDGKLSARKAAAEVLGRIGSEQAIPELIPLLKHGDSSDRSLTAKVLGRVGSEQFVPALVLLLEDEDSWVRIAAAEALAEIGSEQGIPELVILLKDEDHRVRVAAAEALGRIGSKQTISTLLTLMEDTHEYPIVQVKAAKALGEIGGEQAIPALMQRLKDVTTVSWKALDKFYDRWKLPPAIIEALGEIGSEQAIPALIPLLKDEYYSLREKAAEALKKITSISANTIASFKLTDSELRPCLKEFSILTRTPFYQKKGKWFCFLQSDHKEVHITAASTSSLPSI